MDRRFGGPRRSPPRRNNYFGYRPRAGSDADRRDEQRRWEDERRRDEDWRRDEENRRRDEERRHADQERLRFEERRRVDERRRLDEERQREATRISELVARERALAERTRKEEELRVRDRWAHRSEMVPGASSNPNSTRSVEIEGQADEIAAEEDERISRSPPSTKEKIWMMQDQLIMARAYLQFASSHGSAHLIRELKMRMKEIERAISHSSGASRLSGSVLQKMKAMELALSKAQRAYPHCSHMSSKLRAMIYNSEELVRAHQSESSFLEQVAVRTLPKGHHCLAMRLTSEYFSLDPKEREFPKRFSMLMDDFHHYAIFSDNVLASAVVINSTIAASKDPKRIMFHIVTDSLSFPAMTMWFLTNPPSPATIHIKSLDELKWLPADFSSRFKQKGIRDPRYTSALNHLRFYLPEVFPSLSKVLLLDHDVVVQKDLSRLWELDMKGKVNGALETCSSGKGYHQLDNLVNFSYPSIINKFDAKACTFAFGMNIFDLKEWRSKGLSATYDKWFQAGKRRRLWKAGSLPVGQLVFYNQTVPLDHRWHVLGLGWNSNTRRDEIERAAVIHYSGNLKPWLEISIPKYRDYWNRYLNYDNTYLQHCNIHK